MNYKLYVHTSMDESSCRIRHSETYTMGAYPTKYIRIDEVSEPCLSGNNSRVYLKTRISFTSNAPYEPSGPI
jgi:hypothetical protein